MHVYSDHLLHSTVPIGNFPTVYDMTPEMLETFMAKSVEDQLAAIAESVES